LLSQKAKPKQTKKTGAKSNKINTENTKYQTTMSQGNNGSVSVNLGHLYCLFLHKTNVQIRFVFPIHSLFYYFYIFSHFLNFSFFFFFWCLENLLHLQEIYVSNDNINVNLNKTIKLNFFFNKTTNYI
jgi:hypothetical protein